MAGTRPMRAVLEFRYLGTNILHVAIQFQLFEDDWARFDILEIADRFQGEIGDVEGRFGRAGVLGTNGDDA